MIVAGILAGGLGTRMSNGGLPKQFLPVGGIPVIVRTIKRFWEEERIDATVVAMNHDWIDYCKDLLPQYGIGKDEVIIIEGGETRFDSLLCLANECKRLAAKQGDNGDLIMINHDCARPFVSSRIIRDNLDEVKNYDMVTTSIPTIDTVLLSKDGKVSDEVPYRPTVFCDQGPQTIDVHHFLKLVDTLTEDEKQRYMEAGRLYIEKGFRVGIVRGERENFKLTTPFDLKLAELMLQENE